MFGTNFGTINFGNDTANPFDTSFGFANAAIGSFTEFQQGAEYIEGSYTFDNREFYVQDNWKATSKLTLDYGVRFVNATPLYDNLMQGGNFLPERFVDVGRAGGLRLRLRQRRLSRARGTIARP